MFLVIYHLRRYWQGIAPSESVKVRHSPFASENLTITRKRCKIGGKLILITNRKSYVSFRLVLKPVNCVMAVTLRYFSEFGNRAYQLITASSSIELIDQESTSITHIER